MTSYRRSGRLILREALRYSRGRLFCRELRFRAAIGPIPARSIVTTNAQSVDFQNLGGRVVSGAGNASKRDRLREQYLAIGDALLQGEPILSCLLGLREFNRPEDVWIKGSRLNRFRVSVSFVETEILQSYLDDLVDLSISDESLNIRRTGLVRSLPFIMLIASLLVVNSFDTISGPGGFMTGDLVSQAEGRIAGLTGSIAVLSGAAFAGICLILGIRSGYWRRLSFARIVSIEIDRRHGGGRSVGERSSRERFATQGLLSGRLVSDWRGVSEWSGGRGDAVAA